MAATLLKAVAATPSHHHPPHRHLIHGGRKNASPRPLGGQPFALRVGPSLVAHTAPNTIYNLPAAVRGIRFGSSGRIAGAVAEGAARISGWWWMGFPAGRAPSSVVEGGCAVRVPKRWAGGRVDEGGGGDSVSWGALAARQQQGKPPSMGFLHHHHEDGQGEERDRGIDAGNGNAKHPMQQPAKQGSKLMTIPTILTLARVAAVPLFVITFYMDNQLGTTATTAIFVSAAITDWLDGYLARKMRLGTAFGAFLDPVADKLMVAAALILLCTKPLEVAMFSQMHWLLTIPSIAIIGREITMSAVREWAASQDSKVLEAVAVNNLGKWKTATQMTALTILLASRDPSLAAPCFVVVSGVLLLYISAVLAMWSLAVYMRNIWRILLK